MKKPLWLRLVGWLDLALWLWCALAILGTFAYPPFFFLAAWVLYLFAPAAFALFCLWAIVSGIIWSSAKNARIQAAVTRDVAERVVSARTLPTELPTAQTGIACAKCKGYAAVLHCQRHNESVCWRCAVMTDSPDCAYVLANRRQRVDGQRRVQRVATSPLSGIA